MAEVATKFEDEFTKQQQRMHSKPHLTLVQQIFKLESIFRDKTRRLSEMSN